MIKEIRIDNYALIEHTEISLDKGFTVITGETGAGKSILLGAVGLVLGQRADASAVMDKGRKCIVEMVFDLEGYGLEPWFDGNDLDYEPETCVRREVTAEGKSRSFINDTPVSNRLLKQFGEHLVDVHSQHQSLLLGQPEYQTEILDAFCGNAALLEEYGTLYRQYRKDAAALEEMKEELAEAAKEADYLKFQFNQLETADLKPGEKEELEAEQVLLENAEKIKSALGSLPWDLRDTDHAVITVLKNLRDRLEDIEDFMPDAKEYRQRLDSVIIELNDLADEGGCRGEDVEFDNGRIGVIGQRLGTLYDLLFKYKVETVGELIGIRDGLEDRIRKLDEGDSRLEALSAVLKKEVAGLRGLADRIHAARTGARGRLCDEMQRLLGGLGIRHAVFEVEINPLDHFTPYAADDVRFLFAANMNQEPGEIARVASGGEISRVMLALKYVLSASKLLPVIVFDEIDTGVSGDVAYKMACMMREMSGRMQVLSISHLPQIAAAGNCHFKVYKEDGEKSTVSRIRKLGEDERVREIAAMMSGDKITPAALDAAAQLLQKRD